MNNKIVFTPDLLRVCIVWRSITLMTKGMYVVTNVGHAVSELRSNLILRFERRYCASNKAEKSWYQN